MSREQKSYVLQSKSELAKNMKGSPYFPGRALYGSILAGLILPLCWTQEQSCLLSSVVLADLANAIYVMQHSPDSSCCLPLKTKGLHDIVVRWYSGPSHIKVSTVSAVITSKTITKKKVILAIAACFDLYLQVFVVYVNKMYE